MNYNISWGRSKISAPSKNIETTTLRRQAEAFFAAGIVICCIFAVSITYTVSDVGVKTGSMDSENTSRYISVLSQTEENIQSTSIEAEKELTAAEPFGYFNGEWSLWEYIGDSVSSILFGP